MLPALWEADDDEVAIDMLCPSLDGSTGFAASNKQRRVLPQLSPTEFIQQAPTGKTQPAFLMCENANGEEIPVVAKLSSRSERGVTGLAMEGLVALLASDLGLPVPAAYIVELPPDWIDAISVANPAWAAAARSSAPAAFGSHRLHEGFTTWVAESALSQGTAAQAASILLLDAIAKNADRRPENPNCLKFGNELRIIDHELCFPQFLIGVGEAWSVGGLQSLSTPGWHIFRDALHGKDIDWAPITAAWQALSDERITAYEGAVAAEWAEALPTIQGAIDRIKLARDNIAGCATEVQRVLKC